MKEWGQALEAKQEPSSKDRATCFEFDKVLVDGGSAICLNNSNHARTLDYEFKYDSTLFVKNADRTERAVPNYLLLHIRV